MKKHILLQLFVFLSTVLSANQVVAERINICPFRNVPVSQNGLACSFNTMKGEEIFGIARFENGNGQAYVWHTGAITGGRPLNFYTTDGVNGYARTVISSGLVGPSEVRYSFRYGTLNIGVESNRTNLQVGGPDISQVDGTANLPYSVTTSTAFSPGDTWVSLKLFSHGNNGTTSGNHGPTLIEERGLGSCVNRSRCSDVLRIPLTQRNPIPRGHTHVFTTINDQRAWAETTYNDNRFDWAGPVSDFFPEKVPGIMGAYSPTWLTAKQHLNSWIDRGLAMKNPTIPGIDWALKTFISVDTAWFLDPKNARNSRILDKYKELKNPSYYAGQRGRTALAEMVRKKFKDNPSLNEVQLSKTLESGMSAQSYHKQHMSHIIAQTSDIWNSLNPDAVTAAFGGFSFYIVPFGKAKKEGNKYRITITATRTHVMDSFDFNGSQSLGCWREPNVVTAPVSGGTCISNHSFRWYRVVKARGYDFNIITGPKYFALPTPVTFLVDK